MRKKKNYDSRLKRCAELLTSTPEELMQRVTESIPSYSGVLLEVGCGKGRFINTTASRYPDKLCVAVEKTGGAILMAMEKAVAAGTKNIIFAELDAAALDAAMPPASVERICLNFSDPWPGKRHAKRRLTHSGFLRIYDRLLAPDGEICVKTDDRRLFEFSIEELSSFGYRLYDISLDLHAQNEEDNIMTEYEERFSLEGKPINRLRAARFVKPEQ